MQDSDPLFAQQVRGLTRRGGLQVYFVSRTMPQREVEYVQLFYYHHHSFCCASKSLVAVFRIEKIEELRERPRALFPCERRYFDAQMSIVGSHKEVHRDLLLDEIQTD